MPEQLLGRQSEPGQHPRPRQDRTAYPGLTDQPTEAERVTAWFLVVTFATLLGLYWWLGSWGLALYTLGSLWLGGGALYAGYLWWRYAK